MHPDDRTVDRRAFVKGLAATAALSVSLPGWPTKARAAEGGTITVALWPFAHDPLRPFADQFTRQTGIHVTFAATPSAGGDQVAQLTPQFASGSTPVDVLNTSDEATPAFLRAGWLLPLDDVLPAGFWDDFPQVMLDYVKLWSSARGKVYRIPVGWEYGYYWTRQDVLHQLGVQAPATWDEILTLGEKVKAKGMYAFGDAASQPSLAFVYAAFLTGQAGGEIFTFDDGTRQAFAFAKELIDKGAFPKAALNWTYDQSNAAYLHDQLVTMRQWSFFYDVSRSTKNWWSAEKTVIALPPAGPKRRATWAGAWGWTIPKFTKNTDQAEAFVRFITSADLAPDLAKAVSNFLMPRKSILKALGGQGLAKPMAEYADAGVVVARPYHPRVSEAQSVVDSVFSAYLSGQYDLNKAMETGKSGIEALSE